MTQPAYNIKDRRNMCITWDDSTGGAALLLDKCVSDQMKLQQWIFTNKGLIKAATKPEMCLTMMMEVDGGLHMQQCDVLLRTTQKWKWDAQDGGKLCKGVNPGICLNQLFKTVYAEDAELWAF